MYGDTLDDAAPVVSGRSVSGPVEDNDNWNLGDNPSSRDSDVYASLHGYFTAIPMQCRNMSLATPDKAGGVFGLALRPFEALQELREIKTRVVALEASEAEQLAKIDMLKSHECEPLDNNRRLSYQLVTVRVQKEHHDARRWRA